MDSPLDLDLDFDDTRMYIDHPPHDQGLHHHLLEGKDGIEASLPFHPISDFAAHEYSSSPSESSSPGSRELSLSATHSRQPSITKSSPSDKDHSEDMSYVEQFVDDALTIDHLMDLPSSPIDSPATSGSPATPPAIPKSPAMSTHAPAVHNFAFSPSPAPIPSPQQTPRSTSAASVKSDGTWADASFPVNPTGHPVPRDDSPILDIEITPRKSRVETQMTLFMKYENFPRHVRHIRFPDYTVSKPKHLITAETQPDTLNIHTMLVSATAMRKPDLVCRAFERAREKALAPPQPEPRRKEVEDLALKMEKKLLPGSNKRKYPVNGDPMEGGEVIICNACMAREERRAARKKAKPEPNDHIWRGHAPHRIVIVNSNCLREIKELDDIPSTPKYCDAQIRIACYCRHHGEKEGFRIIFTVLDHENTIITQTMSPSLMITDDHKTQTIPESERVKRERVVPSRPVEVKQKRPYRRKSTVSGIASANGIPTSPASASIADALTKALNGIDTTIPKADNSDFLSSLNTLNTTNGVSLSAISSTSDEPPTKRRRASPDLSHHHQDTMSPTISTNVSTPMPHREHSPSSLHSTSLNSPIDFNASFHFNDAMITSPYTESATLSSASSQVGQTENDTDMDPYSIALGESLTIGEDLILENPLTTVDDRNALLPGQPDMELPSTSQGDFTVIHSLIPNHGSCAGGENVTVLGNLLEPDMIVQFGKQAALTQYWNAGCLVCTVPPSPTAGPVIVSLRRKNGEEVRMRTETLQIFTYVQRISQEVMELALRLMKHAGKDPTMNNLIQMTLDTPNVWDPNSSNGMRLRQAAGNGNVDQVEDLIIDGLKRCDKVMLANSISATIKGPRKLTLLHYAAMLDMPKLARFILALSPRTTYVDASGNTAMQIANIFGKQSVAAVIREVESESVSRRSSISSSTVSTPSLISRRGSIRSIDQLTAALEAAQQSVSHLDSILHRVTDEARTGAHSPRERCGCASPGEYNVKTPLDRLRGDSNLIESLKERLDQLEQSLSVSKASEKPGASQPTEASAKSETSKEGLRKRAIQAKELEAAAESTSDSKADLQKTAENRQFWRLPNLQEAFLAAMQGTQQQQSSEDNGTNEDGNNELREFWFRLFKSQMGNSGSEKAQAAQSEALRDSLVAPEVTQSFVAAMVEHVNARMQNLQQGLAAMPAMPTMPTMPAMPGLLARSQSAPGPLSKTIVDTYSWRELFSAPPSYDEIFPDDTTSEKGSPSSPSASSDRDDESTIIVGSSSTSFLDHESEDEPLPEPVQRYLAAKGRQNLTEEEKEILRIHAMKIKRIRGDRRLYFVWIPLLIFSIVAMSLSWGPRVWDFSNAVVSKGRQWVDSGRVEELVG